MSGSSYVHWCADAGAGGKIASAVRHLQNYFEYFKVFLLHEHRFSFFFLCSVPVTNYKDNTITCAVCMCVYVYVHTHVLGGGWAQYIRVFLAESSTKREEMSSSTPASFLAMHVYAPVSS